VADSGGWDVPGNQAIHPIPGEAVFVAAALEYLKPQPTHLFAEGSDSNQGLESGPQPVFHPVRRQDAGLLTTETKTKTIYTNCFTPPFLLV
jgi:hypothetical protein